MGQASKSDFAVSCSIASHTDRQTGWRDPLMTLTACTVLVEPIYSTLSGLDVETRLMLEAEFAVQVPGAYFMPTVRRGLWDGKVRFFSLSRSRILTGLLPQLLLTLDARGIQAKRIYRPTPSRLAVPWPVNQAIQLRDYQQAIVAQAIRARRGVIKAATNAGKTEIAAELIRRLAQPTLYLVHTRPLFEQTIARLQARLGYNRIGWCGEGQFSPGAVRVAMVQTLTALLRRQGPHALTRLFTEGPTAVIADEVHRMTALSWQEILKTLSAEFRFGMSGTPLMEDSVRDMLLIGLTGPILSTSVSNVDLVARGVSARPEIVFIRYRPKPLTVDAPRRRRTVWHTRSDYQTAYRIQIVEEPARLAALTTLVTRHVATGQRVLVLVNWVRHARLIQRALTRAVVISGQQSPPQRQANVAAFCRRPGSCLVATTLFDEGIDMPAIDVLIMAGGGGMSPVKPLQRLGRALRVRPDKPTVRVYDFVDDGDAIFDRHWRRRKRLFEAEGFSVAIERVETPTSGPRETLAEWAKKL